MAQDERVPSAWDFYKQNPAIIYLFLVSKTMDEDTLRKKLKDAPLGFPEEEAESTLDAIRKNPLFEKKDGFIEIDKEVAGLLVQAVEKSFGIEEDNTKDKEIASLKNRLSETLSQVDELKGQLVGRTTIISDIEPVGADGEKICTQLTENFVEASEKPLITGFKVPSVYDSSRENDICSVKNVFQSNIKVINDGLTFIKQLLGRSPNDIEAERRKLLKNLTDDKNPVFAKRTAMQKLIYYLSFYPDITSNQKKNILDACKNGLDANLILELMETDEELFSIEYFDYMVELAREDGEARAMVDLAKRLMLGEWYVSAKVDGEAQTFMLRPVTVTGGKE